MQKSKKSFHNWKRHTAIRISSYNLTHCRHVPNRFGVLVNYIRKGESKMNKKFTTAGVILTAGMLLAACGSDDSTTGSEGSETEGTGSDLNLVEEGKFTSASSGLYKPFNYE